MRLRKRNPYYGMGLDKRQARRMRRRLGPPPGMWLDFGGAPVFIIDEFALTLNNAMKDCPMKERIYK